MWSRKVKVRHKRGRSTIMWLASVSLTMAMIVMVLFPLNAVEKPEVSFVLLGLQVSINPATQTENVEFFWDRGEELTRFSATNKELVVAEVLVPPEIAEVMALEERDGYIVPNERVLAVAVVIEGSKKGSGCHWEGPDYVCDRN